MDKSLRPAGTGIPESVDPAAPRGEPASGYAPRPAPGPGTTVTGTRDLASDAVTLENAYGPSSGVVCPADPSSEPVAVVLRSGVPRFTTDRFAADVVCRVRTGGAIGEAGSSTGPAAVPDAAARRAPCRERPVYRENVVGPRTAAGKGLVKGQARKDPVKVPRGADTILDKLVTWLARLLASMDGRFKPERRVTFGPPPVVRESYGEPVVPGALPRSVKRRRPRFAK